MTLPGDTGVQPCDVLFVGATLDDVARSCTARLVAAARAGQAATVVAAFGSGSGASAALAALGARIEVLELPAAERRDPVYASFHQATTARQPADEGLVEAAAERFGHAAHRSRARAIYLPLGVGGHIDRRVVHEASLRAIHGGDGRDVFLYEERPDALVRGAVRIRLGHVGARLPPGAAHAADDTRLAALMLRAHVAPLARGDVRGWRGRLQAAGVAARHWRESRSWHPQRGFGPRLQPVVHLCEPHELPHVEALAREARPSSSPRMAARLEALARRYARRLGGSEYAERYWLLLPDRQEHGGTVAAPGAA